MPGCYVTRRELLRWMAVAGAAGGAATLLPSGAGAATGVAPVNLELVTLTDSEAVITWYTGEAGSRDDLGRLAPLPADAVVRWGTDPSRLDREAGSDRTDTPYHLVRLTDLEPGRTYYYQAFSGGVAALPTPFTLIEGNAVSDARTPAEGTGPFSFTVPQPPPGRFLFSIVLCNDMHIGETVAGLSRGLGLAGVTQTPGLRPYPEVMFESLVADARALGASYLLAAGDITAEAAPVDLRTARQLFERFGDRHVDWYAARGNHDRAQDGAEYAACTIGAWGQPDCFVDEFFPDGDPTYFTADAGGLRVIGLDTYDKPGDGGDAGALSPDQMDWFAQTLADDPDSPTVVFGHHPLVLEHTPYPDTPGGKLDQEQAATIIDHYSKAPGVFLHHAGHTHRNRRSELVDAPGVVHQEVAAVKEYPGGFTLMRVHEGGYALDFHKSTSDDARAWSERSRTQVGGSWPQFALGSWLADRSSVTEIDLSDLRPAPTSADRPEAAVAPSAGEPGRAATGSGPDPWLAGLGVTALAAGAGSVLALRRRRSSEPAEN